MNPIVLVRAVSAIALPATVMVSAFDRRRSRANGDHRNDELTEADNSVEDPVADLRPPPTRRQLRVLAHDLDDLRRHDLRRADLRGIALEGADLSGLDLRHAQLRRTVLRGALLSYTRLDYADLSSTDLRGADLTGASLLETDLGGADLRGVDLRGTRQLAMANLRNAVTDRSTRYPHGFRPVTAGPN